MIWGTWLDPNFFFRAADDQGHEVSYFCHAVSEAALRERLTRKGLTVLSIEPYDFADWKRRAR
jgi:type II secretory pathway component PulF